MASGRRVSARRHWLSVQGMLGALGVLRVHISTRPMQYGRWTLDVNATMLPFTQGVDEADATTLQGRATSRWIKVGGGLKEAVDYAGKDTVRVHSIYRQQQLESGHWIDQRRLGSGELSSMLFRRYRWCLNSMPSVASSSKSGKIRDVVPNE